MFVGHKHLKDYFKTVAGKNTFHPSYIFYGNEGVGKKLFAVYLAKYVHCENGKFFEDCSCNNCLQIDEGVYPDVVVLDEDQLKIDFIREINERAFMTSFSGKRKFFIFDNFHKIKREAANAMLKTLEEAPFNTTFILVTHNYEMILPTIRSRSIKILFHRLTDEEKKSVGLIKEDTDEENFLKDFDLVRFITDLQKVKERDEFKELLIKLYVSLKREFLNSKDDKFLICSDYLLDILRSVDYNINLDIAKGYLITKIKEVTGD